MQISYAKLLAAAQKRDVAPAVLMYTGEAFFIEEILKTLRDAYGGQDRWSYEVKDTASLDPASLTASAATLSFGGETKLTVVRSSHKLRMDQLDAIQRIVSHPMQERALFLIAEKELKARDKLIEWAKAHKLEICHPAGPKSKDLKKWVIGQVSAKGFSVDAKTVGYMIDLTAGNLMAITQMITKIDLYRGDASQVGFSEVEDLLHDSFEKSVYDCVKAFFLSRKVDGKIDDAMRQKASVELHRVLRFSKNEGILHIIRALAREAFNLLKYHQLAGRVSAEALAKELRLGARKWLLEKEYPARAQRWPAERLHRLLARLAEVDFSLRVSGRDAEAMLEQIIIGNLAPTSVEEQDEIFL